MKRYVLALGLFLVYSKVALTQADLKAERAQKVKSLASYAGAAKWREEAVDPDRQGDAVSPATRAARNRFWDVHLPRPDGTGPFGARLSGEYELLPTHNHVLVVGRFDSFRVFKPTEKGGTYTEIAFHVNTVIANDSPARVLPGASIDICEVGGSVKERDGRVHQYNLQYTSFVMQPGHSYLLELTYFAEGDFYVADRKWDITSGEAVADGMAESESYLNGTSQIGGLSAHDAILEVGQMAAAELAAPHAQEDPLNAQAVPAPLPGQHMAPRTIVTSVPDAKNPVGVIAITYDGKVIRPRSPFNAPDDWLRHITIWVRNESARTMIAGRVQLAFPGIGGDPMVVRYLRVGITPEHQRYTADGKKLPQFADETPAAIAPRDYAKFSIATNYDSIRTEIERRAPIADVVTLVVDYSAYYFEGDLRWMMNFFSKADPDAPGKYIPTAPEDFKTPLPSSSR